MIYVASPYSHHSFAVQEERYLLVRNYTWSLILDGAAAFSPIVYGHRMANELGLATDAAAWWDFNKQMIEVSDAMHILCIDGWKESRGVTQEMEYAKTLRIPVHLVEA